MAEGVELVCFDLGRVLIRICDGWPHACRLAGVPVHEGVSSLSRSAVGELVVELDCGRLSSDAFAEAAAEHLGLTPAQVRQATDSYLLGPFEGVTELLADVRAAGYKTACLSNTHDSHWRMMTSPGTNRLPLEQLDWRFASHLLGLHKPDPAIYEAVEHQTGIPGPAILFFDDLEANIEAARRRGWHGHVITPDTSPVTQVRSRLGL